MRIGQLPKRRPRIPDPVHSKISFRQRSGGRNEEFFEFTSALSVPPVADPHHIRVFRCFQREEALNVRGFVECPCVPYAEAFGVNTTDRIAESQYAVKLIQRKPQNFLWAGVSTMVSIVKQHPKAEPIFQGQNCSNNLGRIPLMNDHNVSAIKFFFQELRQPLTSCVKAHVELS